MLHQHWYTCPISLPVRRNPQHTSLFTVVSATSTPPFQPLCYQRNVCHPLVNRFTGQTILTLNRKHLFMSTICIQSFGQQKLAVERCSSVLYPQTLSPFWLLKPASKDAHARRLPRLSRSWTVLLPSDTHRKPMTSITAVLLPFVICLLFSFCAYELGGEFPRGIVF
jgi:hypothetical protein